MEIHPAWTSAKDFTIRIYKGHLWVGNQSIKKLLKEGIGLAFQRRKYAKPLPFNKKIKKLLKWKKRFEQTLNTHICTHGGRRERDRDITHEAKKKCPILFLTRKISYHFTPGKWVRMSRSWKSCSQLVE